MPLRSTTHASQNSGRYRRTRMPIAISGRVLVHMPRRSYNARCFSTERRVGWYEWTDPALSPQMTTSGTAPYYKVSTSLAEHIRPRTVSELLSTYT
eukprot:3933189-Rhodomonas_salina.1